MTTSNRVIKNTGFLYAKMGITIFISLLTTRLILNSLGASDFGIFNIVGGAIAMLGFLNGAMAGATQRFMSYSEGEGDKEKQTKIFNISTVIHFVISIIMGIVLLIAGYFFFNGILNIASDRIFAAKVVYASLIVSTIFTVMTVPYDAVLNAHENMLYYAIVGVVESLLKLAVALTVLYSVGDKLILYGILMAIIPLITMIVMSIYCHKHYTECVVDPKRYWDKSLMKEMTGFAGWSLIGSISGMVGNYGKGIVINMFFGTVINAAGGVALQLSGQLSTFASTMLKALNPVIAKSEGAGDRDLMLKSALIGIKFSFLLEAVFFIPALLEMDYIQLLWLKNPPQYAALFCRLMLILNLLGQLYVTLPSAIGAVGRIKKFALYTSFLQLFPLIVNYYMFKAGLPPYSGMVLGIGITILQNAIIVVFASRLCGLSIPDYFKNIIIRNLVPFFLSLATSAPLLYLLDEGVLRLFLVLLISIVSFLFYYWVIGFELNERKMIYSNIISILKK